MQGIFRTGLVVLFLMLVLVQGVPAFTVSHVIIDPSGALTPGTPTFITGTIIFDSGSGKNFPDSHELHFVTDLDQAQWNYTLILDKKEIQHLNIGGRILSIDGDTLSFPDSIEESLRFTLSGKVPPVTATRKITLMNISEYGNDNEIAGSAVSFQAVDVSISGVSPQPSAETELRKFRSEIDERSTLGVDTSAAEAKYSEAEQKIKSSRSHPLLALSDSDAAIKAIDDGEILLDRAWAEKEVADAQVPINKVDTLIAWFRGNTSTRDYAQLPAIIAKREVAAGYLATAYEEINSGNYAQAREKARDAYMKANESYSEILFIQQNPPQLIADPPPGVRERNKVILITVGTGAVILITAGIYWWKKRNE